VRLSRRTSALSPSVGAEDVAGACTSPAYLRAPRKNHEFASQIAEASRSRACAPRLELARHLGGSARVSCSKSRRAPFALGTSTQASGARERVAAQRVYGP
jgi:hypothetical protein